MAILGGTAHVGHFDFNVWQAIPYFAVLIAAICGINVLLVLSCGVILFFIIGLATGSLTVSSAFTAMETGTSGMFEMIEIGRASCRERV